MRGPCKITLHSTFRELGSAGGLQTSRPGLTGYRRKGARNLREGTHLLIPEQVIESTLRSGGVFYAHFKAVKTAFFHTLHTFFCAFLLETVVFCKFCRIWVR